MTRPCHSDGSMGTWGCHSAVTVTASWLLVTQSHRPGRPLATDVGGRHRGPTIEYSPQFSPHVKVFKKSNHLLSLSLWSLRIILKTRIFQEALVDKYVRHFSGVHRAPFLAIFTGSLSSSFDRFYELPSHSRGACQSSSAKWVFALYYTALHCTALHCTALHCTTLHCTGMLSGNDTVVRHVHGQETAGASLSVTAGSNVQSDVRF